MDGQGAQQLIYAANARENERSLAYSRGTMASVAGACAGVLGLTNLAGFAAYLLSSAVVGLALYLGATGRKPGVYFQGGAWDVFTSGLGGDVLGFTLWWTLCASDEAMRALTGQSTRWCTSTCEAWPARSPMSNLYTRPTPRLLRICVSGMEKMYSRRRRV